MAPSGGNQAGAEAARLGPHPCSSPRFWDQAATTTVSTPPHRRDPLHLPTGHPAPSPSQPRPLCQVHLLLLAQDPRGSSFPRPAPCYSCCSELVLSPRMGWHGPGCQMLTAPWHDLPPQLPLRSQLPLLRLPLNKQCLCPKSLRCPSVVCLCFSHHHPLSLGLIGHWPLKGATGLGRGHLPPLRLVGKERDEPASKGKRDQKNPVPAPVPSLHEQFLLFRNCFKCHLLYEPCHFQVRELCPSATHPRSLGTVTAWLLCLLPSVDQGF